MDMLPGAIRVILDWFIMLLGTLFTFMEKKEETDVKEEEKKEEEVKEEEKKEEEKKESEEPTESQ